MTEDLNKKINRIELLANMRIEKHIPVEDRIYERGQRDMAREALKVIKILQLKIANIPTIITEEK